MRTGPDCYPPRLLSPHPSPTPPPLYGVGKVHSRANPPNESREKLPGGTSFLEGPRGRYLLPPLRFGAGILRTRYPHMPLETGRPRTSPPWNDGCQSQGPPLVLSPAAKKARYLHQCYLHGFPSNNGRGHHSALLPALFSLPQTRHPRCSECFHWRRLSSVVSGGFLSCCLCGLFVHISGMTFLSLRLDWP